MRRVPFAILLALSGCAEPRTLEWSLAIDGNPAEAVALQAEIRAGGCDGAPVHARSIGGPMPTGVATPRLAPGRYGFWARAANASCAWFAEGCEEAELPLPAGASVVTRLRPLPLATAACDADRCEAGTCRATDGGSGSSCALAPAFDEALDESGLGSIFVAPSGDDAASGARTEPIATLEEAARRATPGTRIRLLAGTHAGGAELTRLLGNADRPIIVGGEPGAVIDAGGAELGLALVDPQYVVVRDLVVRGASARGLVVLHGGDPALVPTQLVVRNVRVENASGGDCIRASAMHGFRIDGVDVSRCRVGMRILGSRDGVVTRSSVHDVGVGSPSLPYGLIVHAGSEDVLVHGNVFSNVPGRAVQAGAMSDAEEIFPPDAIADAARIVVTANLFATTGGDVGSGVMVYSGCVECVFANNTIYRPRRFIARILQEGALAPSRDGWFVNNVIVFRTGDMDSTFVNADSRTAEEGGPLSETFTFGWNLWYAENDPSFTGPVHPGRVPPEVSSIAGTDPRLISPPVDMRLAPGSPAIGAGRTLDALPPGDHRGACFGAPRDIGAYAP